MSIVVSHSVQSDVGLKRTHNEDRYLADTALRLYVVCDGMGGGNAGEVASAIAVETVHRHFKSPPSIGPTNSSLSFAANRLVNATQAANEAVYLAAIGDPVYAGMGTTMVAACIRGNVLSIVHVGDSRLYLIRRGRIQALTTDHSWVAEQVQLGLLTEEEAERSPSRNIVTRALGIECTVDVEVRELPVMDGDRLLLCSDGLTRGVRCGDILRTIKDEPDTSQAVDKLIDMANRAGGDDNTTVLLVTIQGTRSNQLWERFIQPWFPKAS